MGCYDYSRGPLDETAKTIVRMSLENHAAKIRESRHRAETSYRSARGCAIKSASARLAQVYYEVEALLLKELAVIDAQKGNG